MSNKYLSIRFVSSMLMYLIIAGVVLSYFKLNIVSYPHLDLTLESARPETIQLFCDIGDGYNERLSSSIRTSIAQQNGEIISLLIPGACKNVRLDVGDAGSVIKLTSATLVNEFSDNENLLSMIKTPALLNDVKLSESNQVELIATGNDPFVVLDGEYSKLTRTGYSFIALLKMLGIFVATFCFAAALGYWVNK